MGVCVCKAVHSYNICFRKRGVIQRDQYSQGKEGCLWPERVILMATRLPSRQSGREQRDRRGLGKGVVVVREVMKTIHPSPDVSDTERVSEVV